MIGCIKKHIVHFRCRHVIRLRPISEKDLAADAHTLLQLFPPIATARPGGIKIASRVKRVYPDLSQGSLDWDSREPEAEVGRDGK
jgi:hypothetical protein